MEYNASFLKVGKKEKKFFSVNLSFCKHLLVIFDIINNTLKRISTAVN